MTPTERALELMALLDMGCVHDCRPDDKTTCRCAIDEDAIADHIRRAENDALERVASWLDKTRYSSALAKDVRAMKHEVK